MERRQLGSSDLMITPIGVGAWAMGGGNWEYGWGDQDDRQSINAIHRALDLGINWIDTAAVYGLGRSEEVVGRAIKGRSERPLIFTKCSMRWDQQGEIYRDLSAASVRAEVEASLKRLGVDVIDLYQIHWPNPEAEIEEGWATMAELQREGKLRYIGVSNFSVEQMERARAIAPITSLQPPYSLLFRDVEAHILPYCQQHQIGVIAYSPMASGLLTGSMTRERLASLPANDWRHADARFQEPEVSRAFSIVDVLREIGTQHGCSPAEVAIAWVAQHPAVTGAIVGVRSAEQVNGIIGGAALQLSAAEVQRLNKVSQVTA